MVDASDQPKGRRAAEFSIASDGSWRYRGSPIQREALVNLLCRMLECDSAGNFVLVTPDQRLRVDVADAPFVIVAAEMTGDEEAPAVALLTRHGERVMLGPEHPLSLRTAPDGQQKPYVRIRAGLDAVVTRAVFYALAESATQQRPDGPYGIPSGGVFFPLE